MALTSGPPPQRRTGLRRTGPPKRKTPLKPISDKRLADLSDPARAEAREQVFARDQRCLLSRWAGVPSCLGPLTVHHLRKAGQGGPYNALNLVTLCAGHNVWVEGSDAADVVWAWGLVMRNGETYDEVWRRLAKAGLVAYTWTGQPLTTRSTTS